MIYSRRRFYSLLITCFISAGCSTFPNTLDPEAPEVSLIGLQPLSFGLFEQTFKASLRLTNFNDFDLDIRATKFNLMINDKHFAKGISNSAVRVPANGEAKFDMTITTGLNALFSQIQSLDRPALSYKIDGVVKLTGFSFSLPFEDQGEVSLPIPSKMTQE